MTDDDHLQTWRDENHVSRRERDWLRWIDAVEKQAGHVDGDMDTDGYSLDDLHERWRLGSTVDEAVGQVLCAKGIRPCAGRQP